MGKFDQHRKKGSKTVKSPSSPPGFQISVAQCKVCQSPNRHQIDRLLVLGVPAAQVAEQYEQIDGVKYTRKSFANHKNKHMDIRDTAIRRMVEKRAEEAGMDVEGVTESLLTARSVLEAMVHKGFEAVISERVTVKPEDLMAALKHLKEEEREMYASSVEALEQTVREEMDAFIRAVQKIVPPSTHGEIIAQFKKNMSAIRQERASLEPGQ